MPNGKKTLTERMTVIETKFETVIEPMAHKIDLMHENFPEISRKVKEHHTMYNALKEARCPHNIIPEERPKDGNGGYLERRTKKSLLKQFKEMPLFKKISTLAVVIPLLVVYWEWIFEKLHILLNWIEYLPQ